MPAIAVERIEIKIGKKSLTLTPAELKELRDVLDQTFPKPLPNHGPIYIQPPCGPVTPWGHWKRNWRFDGSENRATLCITSTNAA